MQVAMEGYKPKAERYSIEYRQYPGLLITAKGTTLGRLQKLSAMKLTVNEQDVGKVRSVFAFFTSRVITWNLTHPEVELDDEDDVMIEDDGNPACPVCGLHEDQLLPTTPEALYCLELKFILSLIFGWMAVIAGASDPKEPSSSNGGMSIPSEALMTKLAEMQNQ